VLHGQRGTYGHIGSFDKPESRKFSEHSKNIQAWMQGLTVDDDSSLDGGSFNYIVTSKVPRGTRGPVSMPTLNLQVYASLPSPSPMHWMRQR
jgi:hypothetical protein